MSTPHHIPPDQRPALGDWDGPILGQLGVLEGDGERVRCHACGFWFKSLAHHAEMLHGLAPDEYRAVFGLRARTALVGRALSERRRELAAPRLRAWQPVHAHFVTDQTAEERSRRRRAAVYPLEARLDPVNRQRRRESSARGQVRRRELFADPEYLAGLGRRISRGKGGRVEVRCAVCGTPMSVTRSAAKDYQHHLCSPACIAEFRRRWAAELQRRPRRWKTALVCQTCGQRFVGRRGQRFCSRRCSQHATRHRSPGKCETCGRSFQGTPGQRFCSPGCAARLPRPDTHERLRAAARQRGRPYADQLRTLDDRAFAALPPLTREAVHLYYGMADGHPWTHREIARAERIATTRVPKLVRKGVAQLLGVSAMPRA
jgi:hypothetical protein